MKRIYMFVAFALVLAQTMNSQTLTFLLRNGQVIAGPKFQYEVWVKSSDGTSRMGSILVYNNYGPAAFGTNVVAGSRVSVTKNVGTFGALYGQNASNDNAASRFAYSWTYLGSAGSGVVIPSTGDGVLAFTVQINIQTNAGAAISLQGSLMDGEQYKDDEATIWPVIDATSILDDPLPIQLASFTATAVSPSEVRLNWTTLTEINNYGFEVQKSDTTQLHYQSIPNGFVPGHGTTNEPQYYIYTDVAVTPAVWYYRLKQIDLDGAIQYSDGIRVDMLTGVKEREVPTVFSLAQNYPNPWNPATTIHYGLPHNSYVTLTVYNVRGQQVAQLVNEQLEAGYHDVVFHSDGLASGVYFYRIQAAQFVDTRKLLLLK